MFFEKEKNVLTNHPKLENGHPPLLNQALNADTGRHASIMLPTVDAVPRACLNLQTSMQLWTTALLINLNWRHDSTKLQDVMHMSQNETLIFEITTPIPSLRTWNYSQTPTPKRLSMNSRHSNAPKSRPKLFPRSDEF